MAADSHWAEVNESSLRQGDYLPSCLVPVFGPDFFSGDEPQPVPVEEFDLIILSHSCDLEQDRLRSVALCSAHQVTDFEKASPDFKTQSKRDALRKGRVTGLYLLQCPEKLSNDGESLVVDFRDIYRLPCDYLVAHAIELGSRWRLRPPYLEHLSQAFGLYFMRVGLPGPGP